MTTKSKGIFNEMVSALIGLGGLVLKGKVFCILWEWFLVPNFNLKPISTPVAIGIMTTVCVFSISFWPNAVLNKEKSAEKEKGVVGRSLTLNFAVPALYLGFGYLLHQLV